MRPGAGVGLKWDNMFDLGMMMLVGILIWNFAWLLSFSFSVAQIIVQYRFQRWAC